MAPILQFKRGAAGIGGTVPALRPGEPAISTNNYDLFVGLDTSVSGNRFFGSHRYWGREDGSTALRLKMVDKNGTNSVNLKAPDTLAGVSTYTLPATPVDGHYLKVDASGNMSWADISTGGSFDGATLSNSTFTGVSTFQGLINADAGLDVTGLTTLNTGLNVTSGVSTFSGLVDANGGLDVVGGSTFDNINVTGVGTIATADINGGNIDGTAIGANSASTGNFTHLTYNSSSTSGISTVGALYVGTDKVLSIENVNELTLSGIEAIDAVTKATLEAQLQLAPNNFDNLNVTGISTLGGLATLNGGLNVTSGVSTFASLIDANGGLDVTGLATLNTGLNVTSGVSTFAGLVDANAGLDVTGQTTLNNNLAVTGVSTFTDAVTANGNVTLGSDNSDTLTVNAVSTFEGNATFKGTLTGTISTATRSTQIDVTETTTGAEHYVTFVSSSGTANSQTLRVEGALAYNPSDNALKVAKVRATDIQYSDGTAAITIASNGNVGIAQTLTIEGDLTVKGSTTTVNTTELKVEDTLIDLGLENSGGSLIPPTTTTTTDVGTVLNYYSTAARKAAVYWDHTNTRVAIAASVTESAGVLTVQDWGTMASGSILMNGKLTVNDCAGSSDVITCTGSERFLNNITVDAGTF